MVTSGKADAYFSLKRTSERNKTLLFTNNALIKQSFLYLHLLAKTSVTMVILKNFQLTALGLNAVHHMVIKLTPPLKMEF